MYFILTTRHQVILSLVDDMFTSGYQFDLVVNAYTVTVLGSIQGVTKRCCLSWLTNSALVNEPKCEGGGGLRASANEYTVDGHGD
jgi:hypothetical protein